MIKYLSLLGMIGFILVNLHMYVQNISHYRAIVKKEKTENVKAILFYKGEVVKIYRKPIGITLSDKAIDASGELFSSSFLDEQEKNLVTIEGDYRAWPKYYHLLLKHGLMKYVYHVVIKKYKLEVWVLPGVLVELLPEDESIENLAQFYASYPDFFADKGAKVGKRIDLRNTKRVGVSDIN